MPQIRCPNCGISINLENRRNTDYKMILHALKKSPRTFTNLLHMTHLPRKTLSMRLSALCSSGIIVKDGGYRLIGEMPTTWDDRMIRFEGKTLKKPPFFTRKKTLVLLMILTIGVSLAAAGSALFSRPPPSPPPPQYIGTFKMHVEVYDAVNLYAWQTTIYFNYSQLTVIEEEVTEGNFLVNANPPNGTLLMFDVDKNRPGTLTIGGTLIGSAAGVSGTGILATITFGYKSQSYDSPEIASDYTFPTVLLDQDLESTLGTLELALGG